SSRSLKEPHFGPRGAPTRLIANRAYRVRSGTPWQAEFGSSPTPRAAQPQAPPLGNAPLPPQAGYLQPFQRARQSAAVLALLQFIYTIITKVYTIITKGCTDRFNFR